MLGVSLDWTSMQTLLAQYLDDAEIRSTAIASSFGATLELAREGEIELKQAKAFAPLYLRRRPPAGQ
jgi:segregation and condensation protein A